MKLTNKQILITIIIIFVIIAGVGFWYYRKGKKTTTIAPLPADNPNAAPGSVNNEFGIAPAQISQLSGELFNEMDGFSLLRDTEPYKRLLVLSDTDFVKVYNDFNTKYQKEGEGTLKQWIEDEIGLYTSIYSKGEFLTLQDAILTRINRLNLI